jgi:steroid delta-isomerase-like uncharacterized protein
MNRRLMLARRNDVVAAWNRHDADGIVQHVADDVISRDVALGMPLLSRTQLKDAIEQYIAAFPDLRLEITSSTVEGPRIAQEWTMTGTHRGDFMGIPPTGRWTQTYGATIATFDEEAVVIETSMYWNPLVLFRQLGLEPPVAAAWA